MSPYASVAAASAAATTAATSGKPAGVLGRIAVAHPIRRTDNGELNSVPLPRALRAGNLLRLVQHNLLKVRLAILTNVFINRHIGFLSASSSIITATANKGALPKKQLPSGWSEGSCKSAELEGCLVASDGFRGPFVCLA